MRNHRLTITVFAFIFCFTLNKARSQGGLCPDNIDFERGSFANWESFSGWVHLNGGVNTPEWLSYFPAPGQHTLIPASDNSVDDYGGFPVHCPNGSGYSVKLGNSQTGARAEGISYQFSIPSTATVYSIFFHYAVVFQDPNHPVEEQPRFRARIFNVTDNAPIDCVTFDFTASAGLPGFRQSATDPTVWYKDWTPITLNLAGFAGKTLRLEFITSDCTRNGHFGYGYVDVNSNCSNAIGGATVCPGNTETTLTAPFGFQTYEWYADASFSTVVSYDQTYVVSPPPAAGTIYPVVITPFPGFGCRDTVYATITIANNPPANAGPDGMVCPYQRVQLGAPPNPLFSYGWSPATEVSNPSLANPFTLSNLTGPQEYYLKVTDKISGCYSYDTTVVTPVVFDTVLNVTGPLAYCEDDIINTQLQLTATGTGIQWYQDNTPISGATAQLLNPSPTLTRYYWARLAKTGCLDSTRQVVVKINPKPDPGFEQVRSEVCLNITATFKNITTIKSNEAVQYNWRISNGTEVKDKDLLTTFRTPGFQMITLRGVSASGCIDSITKTINVMEFCGVFVPSAFSPNNDGKNEVFRPYLAGAKKLHRFNVYDRSGALIYTTSTIGEGWDGKFKGVDLGPGIFVWILEYDGVEDKMIQKGTVMLLR